MLEYVIFVDQGGYFMIQSCKIRSVHFVCLTLIVLKAMATLEKVFGRHKKKKFNIFIQKEP